MFADFDIIVSASCPGEESAHPWNELTSISYRIPLYIVMGIAFDDILSTYSFHIFFLQ